MAADGAGITAPPDADDKPPGNLRYDGGAGLSIVCIPRHGNHLANLPPLWSSAQRLPGAINVSFYDGHAESVPLERLWQLYGHRDYQPPEKRHGLK